jgi:hypothetical protein
MSAARHGIHRYGAFFDKLMDDHHVDGSLLIFDRRLGEAHSFQDRMRVDAAF